MITNTIPCNDDDTNKVNEQKKHSLMNERHFSYKIDWRNFNQYDQNSL